MDEAGNIVSRIAMLAVYIFGAMSVLAICYAGFMYMTAAGDPQKSGQARNALFGAIGGMIIVGVAFMVPRLISETVIEPSGGASIGGSTTVSCDNVFQNQLVRQQAAGNASRMNQVKVQVQQRQSEECAAEVWNPVVIDTFTSGTSEINGTAITFTADGANVDSCSMLASTTQDNINSRTIATLDVPEGLESASHGASVLTRRDGRNNMLIFFDGEDLNDLPSDGAHCWMYVERLGTWVSDEHN